MTKEGLFACTFQENLNFNTMVKLSQVLDYQSNEDENKLKNSSTAAHDRVHEKGTFWFSACRENLNLIFSKFSLVGNKN